MNKYLGGVPIYIATRSYQRRKHHKRRINKKWRKKYGVVEYDLIPKGEIVMFNGTVWMTLSDFKRLAEDGLS